MKTGRSPQRNHALALVELLVIIAILTLLFAIFCFGENKGLRQARQTNCVNNLKQVGLAYKSWAADHQGKYPSALSVTNGGTLELMGVGEAWRTYQVMSNDLTTPKILFCPADEERETWATNFSADLKGKTSYFIGLDANPSLPQAFLSGDDNWAFAGQPVKTGLLDLASNAPVAWTATRHRSVGNIGLADGSVLGLHGPNLPVEIIQTGLATNRLAIP